MRLSFKRYGGLAAFAFLSLTSTSPLVGEEEVSVVLGKAEVLAGGLAEIGLRIEPPEAMTDQVSLIKGKICFSTESLKYGVTEARSSVKVTEEVEEMSGPVMCIKLKLSPEGPLKNQSLATLLFVADAQAKVGEVIALQARDFSASSQSGQFAIVAKDGQVRIIEATTPLTGCLFYMH